MAVSAVLSGLESVVNILDPGSWFGILALTDKKLAVGRMRAVFPGTVLWLDAGDVRRVLEQEPQVGMAVMTRVATEIGDRYRALFHAIQRNLREEWRALEKQAKP